MNTLHKCIMKFLKRLFLGWIGLLLVVWVASCAFVPTSQEIIAPTFIVTDTQMTSPDITLTSTNAATPQPSATYTSTLTQILTTTPTLTLPAPLEPDHAAEEIRNLLENPPSCSVPCFWGITPNVTTIGEANNFFSRLRSPLRSFEENNFYTSPSFDKLSIDVQLYTQNGLVRCIDGRIGFENYKGQDIFRLMSAFSPANLIRLYGKPSRVEFSISYPTEFGFPAGIAWYSMILRYDQYPFAVDYYRSEVKDEKLIHICPLIDRFSSVDTLFGYEPSTYRSKGKFGTPIEKITSLNIDQFVELMSQEKGDSCFDLNSEAQNN